MKTTDKEKLNGLTNPFVVNHNIETTEITVVNKMVNIKDIHEGIIVNKPSEIHTALLVDKADYCKLFTRAGYRLHINALSSNAKALVLWLMYEIDYAVDYMEIDSKRYVNETSLNYKLLGMAVKELVDACVISPTSVDKVYWINPFFFFKGDRLKKYPDHLS